MDYQTFDPPEDLQDLVRFWWTLESPTTGNTPHRLLAESCPNIVVVRTGGFTEADGSATPAVHLAGPLSRSFNLTAHGPYSLFGIYLWPWAVPTFFRQDISEVMDRFIAADHLFPGTTRTSHWPSLDADAWITDASCLLRALRTDHSRDAGIENCVRLMLKDVGSVSVEEIASQSGLARRQFERRFKASTGFPPALFQRVLRFQRTYRLLENGTANSLTEVALEAGYFDQSHFIRDFKRFGGMDPKSYFRRAPEKVDNFVQLL